MAQTIIVEGLIGAGKSTLSTELGAALGRSTLVLLEPDEQDNQNPYLSDFYEDKTRWSLIMQMHLLGLRYRMQLAAQWHSMSGLSDAVCDRSLYGDVCFARLMHNTGEISDREFETYRTIYQAMTATVLLPSVCVHLIVDPEVAAERIARRASVRAGRKCENVIDLGYLHSLSDEIDLMVDVLAGQGVHVIRVPWHTDNQSTGDRAIIIQDIATRIQQHKSPDLFLSHHRRVQS